MTPSPTVSRPITWPITTTITDIPVGGTTLRASASMFMATIGAGADSMDMEDFTAGAIPIGDMAGITPITVGAGAGTIPGGTTDGAGGAITDLGDTLITDGDMPDITAIGTDPIITVITEEAMHVLPEEGDTTTII